MPRFTFTPLALLALLALLATPQWAAAQRPLRVPTGAVDTRSSRGRPTIHYTLRVDSADLSRFSVEMRLRHMRDTFRLAMSAHPEYDDRYWRFVEDLSATSDSGAASVSPVDSALWRVTTRGGEVVVRYTVHLPPDEGPPRASWRPFLSPTGGLTGGPHAFMYVVGASAAPSHVTLDLPRGWIVATGLAPTSDSRTFYAPSTDVLVDSPMLVGHLRDWRFAVGGVPHRIVYWPRPDATPFDTAAFVGALARLTKEAIALFGRAPYREFTFLMQDGAYAGLEHANSVTLGAPSADIAASPVDFFDDAAHEFLHTWNLVWIRPAERGGVTYRQAGRTRGLWFSEGLTMYYADLLLRRARLPTNDSTRLSHLERLLGRYHGSPGNSRVSPEVSSLAENGGSITALGDYTPSVHLQGEVIGTLLDFRIREATAGRHTMDDVMRTMMARVGGTRGFGGADVERAFRDVCGCDLGPFFRAHIRAARPIDFPRELARAGLRMSLTRIPAVNEQGEPVPDLRLFAEERDGDPRLRLRLTNPASLWGRAGLHTGDLIASFNGAPIRTTADFRTTMRALRIGDTARIVIARQDVPRTVTVVVTGYARPAVRIAEMISVTPLQRLVREGWLAAAMPQASAP